MARSNPAARGFTLLELMVVVIVIGVLAALAVPSIRLAIYDRRAYQDAGAIMQLFREARLRAIARGGAVVVTLNATGTRGTFNLYEAVQQDPADLSGQANEPVSTCRAPMKWIIPPNGTLANNLYGTKFVDGIVLDGPPEVDADIQTSVYVYTSTNGATPAAESSTDYVCYTPLGRSYFISGSATPGPVFDGQEPTTNVIEVRVSRGANNGITGASTRSVLVEPNGMPRIITKLL